MEWHYIYDYIYIYIYIYNVYNVSMIYVFSHEKTKGLGRQDV